ncbi:MAG: tetratricopeptide repeat protein [Microcystaceae cyanobacterium]
MIKQTGFGLMLIGAAFSIGSCGNAPIATVSPSPTISVIAPTTPVPVLPADRKAAQNYRQSGLKLRQQGNYTEAIASFEKGAKLDPSNLSGRILWGWTLHLAEKETEATEVLQQVLVQDANNIPALNALGIVYLVSGNLNDAVKTHQQAVNLNPKNEIAHYNLALAYQRLKDYDSALTHAQQATQLEPNNPHTWVAIALVYWDKGDKSQAKTMYKRAINLDPRYRQSSFLSHLKLAGLSGDQIQLTTEIQKYVKM